MSTSDTSPVHVLLSNGAPYDDGGHLRGGSTDTRGPGRALCSCGALSDVLTSLTARRKWHKEHRSG